jgi:hypothetical protein
MRPVIPALRTSDGDSLLASLSILVRAGLLGRRNSKFAFPPSSGVGGRLIFSADPAAMTFRQTKTNGSFGEIARAIGTSEIGREAAIRIAENEGLQGFNIVTP